MAGRRGFLIAVSAGMWMLARCPTSFAQRQGRIWRVGFLAYRHMELIDTDYYYGPFTQGMRDVGYVVGKNLSIEWRSAGGKIERLPDLAAELVRLKVDVLVTAGASAALAAQKATTTIPIVMGAIGDPVGSGLVNNLARPGGNSTGTSTMTTDLAPKRLELLRGMAPTVTRVAVLVNPSNTVSVRAMKEVQAVAEKLGLTVQPVPASTPAEIAEGFAAMLRQKAGALIVPQEPFFIQQKDQIVQLVTKYRLPSIGADIDYVESGGLMFYGANLSEAYRRAATYVDKILKGARAGDLPVEQPTTFDLYINRKAATALGITIPQAILTQATRVIE